MERILRGIMRYRHTTREQMVKEFQKVRDNPQVSEMNGYDTEKPTFNFHYKYSTELKFFMFSSFRIFKIIYKMSCSFTLYNPSLSTQ